MRIIATSCTHYMLWAMVRPGGAGVGAARVARGSGTSAPRSEGGEEGEGGGQSGRKTAVLSAGLLPTSQPSGGAVLLSPAGRPPSCLTYCCLLLCKLIDSACSLVPDRQCCALASICL